MRRFVLALAAVVALLGGPVAAQQQSINVGSVANDGTGDTPRVAFTKTNTNFSILFSALAGKANIVHTHAISDVVGLAAALTGFQPASPNLTALSAYSGVGTTAGTLAAGNDARIANAIQPGSAASLASLNLSSPLALSQGGCGATSALGCLTNLGLAGGASGYVLTGNGPGAVPTYQPAASGGGVSSSALDSAFGNAQGSILYRGASAWQALAPGAAGSYLQTGGPGANLSWASIAASSGTTVSPQGRLTLTSGVPSLTSAVSGATSVLYTPAIGNLIPIWNGSAFAMTTFAETTQALSDASKSPSAAAASQVYDLFAWLDGSTFRVTRGPAWSAGATAGSNLARGSGAGSTALTRVSGILVNAAAITNGPAAGFGTYVGTIATDASGATVSFNTGSAAAGGGAATIGLWNAYNRVPVRGQVRDTTTTWNYGQAVWEAAHNSTTNRVTFVTGLQEDAWRAEYDSLGSNGNGYSAVGIGFNTVTAFTGVTGFMPVSNSSFAMHAVATVQPSGSNYLSAIEYAASGTTAFNGLTAAVQTGLTFEGRY